MSEPTLTEQAVALIDYLDTHAKPAGPPVIVDPDGNPPAPTIADLLAQSRNAHLVYRRSLRHRAGGQIVEGNPVAAAEAVALAARLRAQAEVLDPQHAETSWADDLLAKFPHEALVQFYAAEVKYYVPPIGKRDTKPVEAEPITEAKP